MGDITWAGVCGTAHGVTRQTRCSSLTGAPATSAALLLCLQQRTLCAPLTYVASLGCSEPSRWGGDGRMIDSSGQVWRCGTHGRANDESERFSRREHYVDRHPEPRYSRHDWPGGLPGRLRHMAAGG